jgi:hypothetical protein
VRIDTPGAVDQCEQLVWINAMNCFGSTRGTALDQRLAAVDRDELPWINAMNWCGSMRGTGVDQRKEPLWINAMNRCG